MLETGSGVWFFYQLVPVMSLGWASINSEHEVAFTKATVSAANCCVAGFLPRAGVSSLSCRFPSHVNSKSVVTG